ncbi:MAG: hypothetical protein KAS73_06350 [Candidatus Sabulitectum sp.]|nr:hypothetical protein [Candidatus Sabulitectum sp.]
MSYIDALKKIIKYICEITNQLDVYQVFTSYISGIESQSQLLEYPVLQKAQMFLGFGKGLITFENPAAGARATIDTIISTALRRDVSLSLSNSQLELLRPLLSDLVEKDLFNYHYATCTYTDGEIQVHRFKSADLRSLWYSGSKEQNRIVLLDSVPSVELPKHEPKFLLWIEREKGHEVLMKIEDVFEDIELTGNHFNVIDPNVHSRQLLGYLSPYDKIDGSDK